ncbi:MAG: hypothetical protein ABW328_00875 [Ilumatobacteraceae bacterium]
MTVSSSRLLASPLTKLVAYGVVLLGLLAGGAAVGAAVGPDPAPAHGAHDTAAPVTSGSPLPAGLAVSSDGYQLQLATTAVAADTPAELRFVITGPDGAPVTTFDVAHDKELHFIVVSRDLATFAHVHPERDAAGTWAVTVPAMSPGSYRVYADFVPAGGAGLTLAADLAVPGAYTPQPVADPTDAASVDGYDVSFDGDLVAGEESELTVTVTRNGEPVTDLDPYLGSLGHLVAIRDGDLAYLHVHPLDELDGPGGPAVRFAVDVPTAGTYGLYVDFSHDDTVRTAAVTVAAANPGSTDTHATEPAPTSGGHDAHEG